MWLSFNGSTNTAAWKGNFVGEELYSHTNDTGVDFDAFENINLAHSSQYVSVREELLALLRQRFDSVNYQ